MIDAYYTMVERSTRRWVAAMHTQVQGSEIGFPLDHTLIFSLFALTQLMALVLIQQLPYSIERPATS